MDRKERIIRLVSIAGPGIYVKDEGIGSLMPPEGYHVLGTTFFI